LLHAVSSFCATRGLKATENLSGHSRIAPFTLRYVCVFFRVDAHGFGLCDLLLTSLACLSGACNFCGERQRRRCDGKTGPLCAYRIVPVHNGGSKILPSRGSYQVRRAKTNTAIGNNVLTEGEDEHGHWQQRFYRRVIFVLPTVCASQNLGMFL
jgi:hypothetical protein